MFHGQFVWARCVVVLVIACWTGEAWAADWYVDAAAGNDASSGTQNRPLQSIAQAMKKAKGGDNIYLAPGKYSAIHYLGGKGKHLYQNAYVTIAPVPGVKSSRESISIERVTIGAKLSVMKGKSRRGVFDAFLRVRGVHILDGVMISGGRHFQVVDCLIEKIGPWTGSSENMSKTAVYFGDGYDQTARDCEITRSGIGVVILGPEKKIIGCHIHRVTHDGIRAISSKDSLIENCRIHNIDDGLHDNQWRKSLRGPKGENWNRHCDGIHIFIPGPGYMSAANERLTIRGCVIYDVESQAIQFNNAPAKKDTLWNKDVTIENCVFGPTYANPVNIASPTDGVIFRHNSFVYFHGGRTFQGKDREITGKRHIFRINAGCKRVQIYNNILCNKFYVSPGWKVGHNLYHHLSPKAPGAFTRNDKVVPDAMFANPDALDGVLKPGSPAIDRGTRLIGDYAKDAKDMNGVKRDLRPDCGAFELPGRSPKAEKPLPKKTQPIRRYIDDFMDANTSEDPWLAGAGMEGLAWRAPKGFRPWRVDGRGKLGIYMGRKPKAGAYWMISTAGDDWADYSATVNLSNVYNNKGGGVLLRASRNTTGYLVDLVAGKITRRTEDSNGKIESHTLTNTKPILRDLKNGKFTFAVSDQGQNVSIQVKQNGKVVMHAIDDSPKAIRTGRIGLYCNSKDGSHRTNVHRVEVTIQRRAQ